MAAELDTKADGSAAMFYHVEGGTPWHGEGVPVNEALSVEAALEVAGIGYEVETVPLFRMVDRNGEGAVPVAVPEGRATVRTDKGTVLGVVGARYHVIPNSVAFAPLDPLVSEGLLVLDTGGALRGGADAWLLGRLDVEKMGPIVREVFGTEVAPYILASNNFSGRRNWTLAETPIRVVCANTLAMAEAGIRSGASRSVSVRHTAGAHARTVDAALVLFEKLSGRYEAIARKFARLKAHHLDMETFSRLVLDVVAPLPQARADFDAAGRLAEVVVKRAEDKRAEVSRLWSAGAGHKGDASAWEAYNGAVEALDHDRAGLFPVRGSRVQALADGALREMKDAVLVSLLADCPR